MIQIILTNYMTYRKLGLNLGLILVFTLINYILSQYDEDMNRDFFKIKSLLDSFYFTILSHITSFFKYNSSSIKLTNSVKLSVCLHIVLFIGINMLV